MVYLFLHFYFPSTHVIEFEVSLILTAYNWVIFKTCSANLCLLFRPLTFSVIMDMLELKSAILLFVFCLLPLAVCVWSSHSRCSLVVCNSLLNQCLLNPHPTHITGLPINMLQAPASDHLTKSAVRNMFLC